MPGLLAVVAVSTAMTATALANSTHIYLIEQTPLTSGSEALEGAAGLSAQRIETTVAKVEIVKECQDDTGTGVIKPGGQSEGRIEGRNCYIYTKTKTGAKEFLPACTVKEPVVAEFTGELIETAVGEVGSFKGEIVLEGGSCAVAGKFIVEGKQICASREPRLEKVSHEAICTPAGSNLKLGKERAQLFGTGTSKLKSGKKWAST